MEAVPRIACKCAACGAEVLKRQSDLDRLKTGRVFCSAGCRKRVGARPRKRPVKTCVACATNFYPAASAAQMYCSKACKDRAQNHNPDGKPCKRCGVIFFRKTTVQQYCSRDCWTKAQYRRPLGREHNGRPAVVDHQGYVRVFEPSHPKATRSGWVF